MFKSLRLRIVLILTLLTVAVMIVVGAFLMNSVADFYNADFRRQMDKVFTEDFMLTLRRAAQKEYGYAAIDEIMRAYSGQLGIDSYRNYYVLESGTGNLLTGSDMEAGLSLERTPNLIRAMAGGVGDEVSRSASYFDYATCVSEGGNEYIVYIKDSKDELNEMVWMIFAIILQAMLFGLIIAFLMSYMLSKAITNPVESITRGAQLIAAGNFTDKLPVKSKDEIGTLTKTFNSMADVLKNTIDEVEGERNKLSSILLYLTDGVAAFTRDGVLLHINPAAYELLGVKKSGRLTFSDLFDEESSGITWNGLRDLHGGQTPPFQFECGEKILSVQFAPFSDVAQDEGQLGGYIAVIHDITEQQKFERSRREFVANVSHELRTPLTSIKSYTETVLDNQPMPAEQQERFLGVVINETDRMTRIVKDLLVLSRLDNNKMEWVFSRFSVRRLMDNIYDAMLMDARKHGHKLTLNVENELGEMTADRDRIEQVVINILSNAIKYTPDGGHIDVTASRRDDMLRVSVRDDGLGIPKEDLPRLFERFYRVDKARSRERGGTGLGLAIAREIVIAHNGSIDVESEVGRGTTVTMIIPCVRETQEGGDEGQA